MVLGKHILISKHMLLNHMLSSQTISMVVSCLKQWGFRLSLLGREKIILGLKLMLNSTCHQLPSLLGSCCEHSLISNIVPVYFPRPIQSNPAIFLKNSIWLQPGLVPGNLWQSCSSQNSHYCCTAPLVFQYFISHLLPINTSFNS